MMVSVGDRAPQDRPTLRSPAGRALALVRAPALCLTFACEGGGDAPVNADPGGAPCAS